jgi:hypothetical protein
MNRPLARQPGQYDWRDLFKPTDPAVVAVEIRRLKSTGLTARDIAATLDLNIAVVLEALRKVVR